MRIYLVGGAIRDQLLGRPVRERDWLVVGATPQEMQRRGFRPKDPDFPVYLHPDTGEEYALARRESKMGSGHKGFEFDISTNVTLEQDLARRDLTINAMAQSESGEIIDPHHGRIDLQARFLRHVTPAFVEDPLRVLRLLRFNAELANFNFSIDEKTRSLAAKMCKGGELRTLSAGRVWRETARALVAPAPEIYFRELISWGALTHLMPWLPGEAECDPEYSLVSLSRVSVQSEDPDARLATFLTSMALRQHTPFEIPMTWPIPSAVRTLYKLCIDSRLPSTMDAQSILRWLESVDAWRRGDRFTKLLQVLSALQPDSREELHRLRECRDSSRRVSAPKAGLDPREAVRELRLQHIARTLKQVGQVP